MSTSEIAARKSENSSGKIRRQVTKLLAIKRYKSEDANIELKDGEIASVRVYTRASDGAQIVLNNGNQDEIEKVDLNRNEKEEANEPFHRDFVTSLSGPGTFCFAVERSAYTQLEHFLVVAKVSNVDE
uniref:Uncharacterized protein n=2 Tax=Ditylum brightwellii TaxID=49249 RepID=A0A7S1Z532_9STRA